MSFRVALYILKLCGVIMISLAATTVKPKAKSGPYTSTALGLKTCDNPSQPYVKDPVVRLTLDKNYIKKSLVKGNVTILKDTQNVKTSIKEFYYEDRKWQMTFNVKNQSCRSQLGTYSFEVNYNTLDHLWMANREYGRLLRRIEASTKAGTIICLEFEENVGPEKH
ncbi:hypothetical protein MSG28_005602 [Choristoneura fumiferana]|uniref:Uncharacterized protein n=1 Tax=Choristoneura fumiferana TaxID=7141 RepID=A0ACC0L013_CHOFU|nr:hypothetical protein MSG28_005602 [Choristoneura fumiferana]